MPDELLGVSVTAPRASFEVREVTVDTALRKDPLPGIDYSFNPYIGCHHGCVFCYTPRLMRMDRNEWGTSVVVKRNAATVVAKEVRKLPRGLVAISTATDPYQFVEGKYRVTRHALEVLLRAGWPVSVLSRAPLMIRDLDLFTQFANIEVGMSVPTLDDRARALLEPSAPPIDARLRCLRQLADAGLTTFVSFAPAYPPTGGVTPEGIADAFSEAGVSKMFTRTLDGSWGALEAIETAVRASELREELSRIGDPEHMTAFIRAVGEACQVRGISFRAPASFVSKRDPQAGRADLVGVQFDVAARRNRIAAGIDAPQPLLRAPSLRVTLPSRKH